MKKFVLLIMILCSVLILCSGCTEEPSGSSDASAEFPKAEEPVADAAGQQFNTWDKFLPLTLRTESGGTAQVTVKATIDMDCSGKSSIKEQMKNGAGKGMLENSEGWDISMMDVVKIQLLVMPWDDTDFEKDEAILTFYAGMYYNGNALGGSAFAPQDNQGVQAKKEVLEAPILTTDITKWQSGWFEVYKEDEMDPVVYSRAMVLVKPPEENPYYEVIIYGLVPRERVYNTNRFMVSVTDYHTMDDFMEMTFKDLPNEGKLCWEIPDFT